MNKPGGGFVTNITCNGMVNIQTETEVAVKCNKRFVSLDFFHVIFSIIALDVLGQEKETKNKKWFWTFVLVEK